MKHYPSLFSPVRIGSQVLKNRIIMPAMGSNNCNLDGSVSPAVVAHYAKRARGGAGMIIIEITSVDYPAGCGGPVQLRLNDPGVIPGFRAIADSVHPYGAKLIAQLHHAGLRAFPKPGVKIVGPVDNLSGKVPVYGMTKEDIADLTAKFAKAAKHAQIAGLDGVELHAGHGYLFSQFLSPLTNTRTDEYGGDAAGRARFLLETVQAVRKACGPQFILSVRLAVRDWDPKGQPLEDGIEFAKMLDGKVDLINITTGARFGALSNSETQDKPDGFRLDLARAVKPHVKKTPVSIVGKLRTGEMCESVIKDGVADLVVVGRQILCDPEWPNKLGTGREREVRKCLNCMECYGSVMSLSGIRCAINPYCGFDSVYDEGNLPRAAKPKKVVVVGGGVTGMQAAVTAAERGHAVTLLEKSPDLGGQIRLACVPPHKEILGTAIDYFEMRLKQEGVEVRLGVDADAETVASLKPDTVIVAAGSLPYVPPIPGIEHAAKSWDILDGAYAPPEGKRVVIIGGGSVGCDTALYLLTKRNKITIIEMLGQVAAGQEASHRTRDLETMEKGGVNIQTLAAVQSVSDAGVAYTDKDGASRFAEADLVVVSTGQRPVGADLALALEEKGIKVTRAGDAMAIGKILTNVRSGFLAGYDA